MSNFFIRLTFNQQNYSIPVLFPRYKELLNQFPQSICEQILQNLYYIVTSDVKKDTFENFKKYLADSIEPEINVNNMFDYYLLSQEFHVLTEYFSNKIDENRMNISILCSNSRCNKAQNERYVSIHLDYFIENHKQELFQIPINSLYNIFFHRERVLKNHQKAYDLIIEISSKDNSFYVLLPSLDAKKLNYKSQTESIVKSKERFGYHPKSIDESENNIFKEETIALVNEMIKTERGKTILHWSSENNKVEITKYILSEKEIDINSIWFSTSDGSEKTALHLAVENNFKEIVELLLSVPTIDVNIKAVYKLSNEYPFLNKKTALHIAVENKNTEIVQLLLENHNIDVNCKLEISSLNFSPKILSMSSLLKGEGTALHIAVENGSIEIVKLLLAHNDIDINAIYIYEQIGDFDDKDAPLFEPYYYEKTALHIAIMRENIEIIQLLLENSNVDVNAIYKCEKAIMSGYIINPDSDHKYPVLAPFSIRKMTPLHLAIEVKNTKIAQLLLSNPNISINALYEHEYLLNDVVYHPTGSFSKTALHFAVENNCNEIVQLLLANHDVDINAIYKSRTNFLNPELNSEKTALHIAIENKNIDMVKLLLANNNININAKYNVSNQIEPQIILYKKMDPNSPRPSIVTYSKTPLHIAVENESVEIVILLLENNAIDINDLYQGLKMPLGKEMTLYKKTALHIAVENKNVDIVQLLLKNENINLDIKNINGNTPIEIADDPQIKSLFK